MSADPRLPSGPGPGGGLSPRPMTGADAAAAARIHHAALLDPLRRLGTSFMQAFYRRTVELGEIAVVVVEGTRVVGFAVGSLHPGELARGLARRHALGLGLRALPGLVRHPTLVPELARRAMAGGDPADGAATATLMFLAVDPAWQRRGAGRLLVEAFIRESVSRGAVRIALQTERRENDAANAFYRRLGFRLTGAISTGQRVVNAYELDLRESARRPQPPDGG
jgi:ribosomal protein S18 acetylase RimI-like enzyme